MKEDIGTAYLDNACIGRVHGEIAKAARDVADGFCGMKGSPTDFTVELFDRYERGRAVIAETLRVSEETICYVESTSHGLGMIANSLDLREGDNVLVCDLEFFSAVLCWRRHSQKRGFEVRPVRTWGGCVRPEDFERAADGHTRAIVISAVQEIDGYRADMEAFGRLARRLGAWLIVDGIQEVGALNPRLDELNVDVYCSGGHKWLRNPFGTGFMYINKDLVGKLEPDFYGYFNAKPPAGGWGPYLESPLRTPFDELELTAGAAKFETGATVNYTGAFALIKSFELLREQGLDEVEREVLERRRYLQEKLLRAGAEICGSVEEKALSGICTFNLPGGLPQERELMKLLEAREIYCSLRYISGVGGIRLSPHAYTEYAELDYLLDTVTEFIKR